ncbi:MAG: S9 family peptidase [Myxococcales bacterium]
MARSVLLRSLPLAALAIACANPAPRPDTVTDRGAPARPAIPPILDRELLFGDPEISSAQLSPDGRWISFLKPLDGTRNLWVKRREEPFDKARPVTADTKRPIPGHFWSRDSRFVLFVQDQGGDENYNVFAVDPAAPVKEGAKVPEARPLTDAKGSRAVIYEVPKKKPGVLYVGLNDRDPAWHDLYEVEIATARRTLLRKNDQRFTGYDFDLDGRLRLAARVSEKGDTEILRLDEGGMGKIYGCGVLESCHVRQFHKDGKRAYLVTNAGAGDLERLASIDVATGAVEPVESDPQGRVDLLMPIFSSATDELVGTLYDDERFRFYWRDPSWGEDHGALARRFPGRNATIQSETLDGRFWLVAVAADVEPGEVHLFDRKTKETALQFRLREKLPREALAPMQAIRYPSSDGLSIPAFLTLPVGVEPRALPLIVLPHGGPWARDRWGYSTFPQFLANRGYAVLQPNFRASTGYGKKFLDSGNRQWGDKMQDDLTWGVRFLVDRGTVDPKRVGITGGSYGGYATLAGVTFTPDLYAGAVAIVAPSNLITLLSTIPPYWEAIRVLFHTRMGDPNTFEGQAQLVRQSPLTHAAKIKTPLMVVQGANDPRVKRAEADQIVVALRERHYPVEYLVAPDEGHGFARPVNNMAAYAAAEKFLAKHVGGRFQEGMTPEVAKRLQEITVDTRTVELPKAGGARAP